MLRGATIGAQSFWDDERYTVWLVRMDFGDMLRSGLETEVTPPLYYVVAWLWSSIFGSDEVGLRALSVLAGAATVPILYVLGARHASRRAGLAVAALAAVNPFLVWYGEEARSYALLVPETALGLLFFLDALRAPTARRLGAWAVVSCLALSTHYFSVFIVGPEAAWLLLAVPHERRRAVLAAVAAPVLAGIALLPILLHQRAASSDPGGLSGTPLTTRTAAVPKNFLVGYQLPVELLASVVTGLLALVLAVVAVRSARGAERRMALIAAALAAIAVGVPIVLAGLGQDYVSSRNVIVALVPAVLVAGVGLVAGRAGLVAGLALCSVWLAILGAVSTQPRYQRKDHRGAARALGPVRENRLLAFSPGFVIPGPFLVYFPGSELMTREPVATREIDVVALASVGRFGVGTPAPPRSESPRAPAGFRLVQRRDAETFTLLRYRARRPIPVTRGTVERLAFKTEAYAAVIQRPD